METQVTRTLAEYIVKAKLSDFPPEVVHRAKMLMLDNIGCAFGGYPTENGKELIAVAKEMGGRPESTVIGDGTKVSSMVAAGTNAQMANIIDFDDESGVTGHPGSATVQTALSVGERLGSSGKDLITAVIVGFEVFERIAGGAPRHSPKERASRNGIPVSHHVFGSAVAAAEILGLDVPQAKHAIGIAGATAPTFNVQRLTDRPASPVKCCNLWNCLTGVSAAMLARQGMAGPVDYLDGKKGYWSVITDETNFDAMVAELGQRYLTLEIRPKPYASCGQTHSALQLATELVRDECIRPEDIQSITVRASSFAASFPFDGQRPIEPWDAVFSIPFVISVALLGYETGPDWYTKERFNDPAVLGLAAKIKTEVLPEADIPVKRKVRKMPPCEVEITAKGRSYVRRMLGAKGDVDQPFTDDEYKNKFRGLARRCLSGAQVEEIVRTMDKLEDLRNVMDLAYLLKPV